MQMRTVGMLLVQISVAQTALWGQEKAPVEYAAKYVCGTRITTTTQNRFDAVSLGVYHSAINIHNPGPDSTTFFYKIATTQARPLGGAIVRGGTIRLLPDQALEIDCAEILRLARSEFSKGFLVIQSARELDVVAVYTAGPRAEVQTMDVERVPARVDGRLP